MADGRQYRSKFYLNSAVFLVLIVAVLCLVNLTSDQTSRMKLDLSKDKLYSISDATVDILKDLKDNITVTYYCSESMSSFRTNLLRNTRDMFEEFRRLSGGRFKYELVDPEEMATEHAVEMVAEYKEKEEKEEKIEEPQRPIPIMQMFGRRQQPTDDEVRERRKKDAATIAKSTQRDEKEVYYEILGEDYKEKRLGELEQEGIRAYTFMERTGSSARQVKVYSAIQIEYLNKQPEIIPLHQFLEGLEYDLAHRVVKLVTRRKPIVAFFDARKPEAPPPNPTRPMPPPLSEYAAVIRHLGDLFDVREIDLKDGDAFSDLVKRLRDDQARDEGREEEETDAPVTDADMREFISCVVVAQPDGLEDRQVYEINRAVSLGIPTLFLVSPFSMDASPEGLRQGLPIVNLRTGLEEVFRNWGLELRDEILASNNCGGIPMQRQMDIGNLRIPVNAFTPLAVIVAPGGHSIDQTHALTNSIGQLAFPATPGFRLAKGTLEENEIRYAVLASAPKESWSVVVDPFENMNHPFMRNQAPGVRVLFKEELAGRKDAEKFRDFVDPSPLAVYLQGKFPFNFEGQTIPEWKKEEESADAPPADRDLLLNPVDPLAQEEGARDAAQAATPPAETPPAETDATPSKPEEEDVASTAEKEAEPEKAHLEPADDGKVIVLASTDLFKDSFLQYFREFDGYRNNVQFIQNTIELFGLDQRLLDIRRKTLSPRDFKPGSGEKAGWIQGVNLIGIPLVVALIGIARFLLRRRESNRYERRYIPV